jgi:4-carboxymuconolactone decarboxylase
MRVSKIIGFSLGFILLAGIVAAVPGASLYAQNSDGSTASRDSSRPSGKPLPKDVYADSRNRLPLPKREDMDEEGRKIFDQLTQKSPLAVGIEQPGARLYSPKLARAIGESARYRKYQTGLSNRLLEVAVLTTAREMDSQYEWTQWEEHGRDPKDPRFIEPAIIDIIKYEKPLKGLGEKEAAIIQFGRELFGHRNVSPETFAQILRLFGRRGTVDLFWIMTGYSSASIELTAFDQQLREDQKPLLPPRARIRKGIWGTPLPMGPPASGLPKDVFADSRNRLPLPKRENMEDEESKKIFDELTRKSELAVGIEQASVRLHSPRLARAVGAMAHYVKYESGLSNRLLEITVLTTAREMDSQYEWTQWEEHGRDPKDPRFIEPAIIDMIKYRKPVKGLGEKEAAIIQFGRELLGQRKVAPATFAGVLRLFGRKGTVDLVWLMASYSAAASELVAFNQQLREGQKPLLPPANRR